MLSHKMDFNCCANRDGFRRDSHKYTDLLKYIYFRERSLLLKPKRGVNRPRNRQWFAHRDFLGIVFTN